MPYEDPMEATLRALTDVEWRRRDGRFEARINHTHLVGIQEALAEYQIAVAGEVSAARSGRYIATVSVDDIPKITKAAATSKVKVKPQRRKGHGG